MTIFFRPCAQWLLLTSLLMVANQATLASDANIVAFDAPAIVIAEPINPGVVEQPTMGGDIVRLRIPVSTFQHPEFRGQVQEYVFEVDSSYQTCRVLDFWPKNEVYSDIDGNVAVDSSQQRENNFNFNLSAAYEPIIGRATVQSDAKSKSNVQERFQRKPPMQILSSSGTVRRGYGVMFKFRPGPLPVLEGVRDLAVLAEVPRGWRADMLQVTLRATGVSPRSSRPQQLGEARLWVAVHREGDAAAAAAATRYVTQERALRSLAASSQSQVNTKALPTFWHKIGASLDVVEPRIPADYLTQVIFSTTNRFRDNEMTNRLPVNLRVAVLDYWDSRNSLLGLPAATPSHGSVQVSYNDRQMKESLRPW